MTRLLLIVLLAVLTGCASGPKFTVDDGRKVDETLLAGMRAYGAGERLIRPAIARSAALKDKDCDKQWELPFAVATSEGWSADDRVAWARALQVDERLTLIAVTQDSPLPMGTRLNNIAGQPSDDGEKLLEWLAEARDGGKPFNVGTAAGKTVQVKPFEVCRGYTRFAPPNTPQVQDYHWLLSLHPLEVTRAEPTPESLDGANQLPRTVAGIAALFGLALNRLKKSLRTNLPSARSGMVAARARYRCSNAERCWSTAGERVAVSRAHRKSKSGIASSRTSWSAGAPGNAPLRARSTESGSRPGGSRIGSPAPVMALFALTKKYGFWRVSPGRRAQ